MRHKYVAAILAAGTIFLFGTFIVASRSGAVPAGTIDGLNINGVIQGTNPAAVIPNTPQPVRPTAVDVPYTKITTSETNTQTQREPAVNDGFSWDSFITMLTHDSPRNKTPGTNDAISDAYAFIPSGLMSIEQPQKLATLSDSQKALYEWGTAAGSVILTYENLHPDQPATLTNFMQDRENKGKIAAMKKLGADLAEVGDSIDNLGLIPPQMSMAAPALADAYREIGRNLAAVPDAKSDNAIVDAILKYNASAEAFAQKYVNVVLIFQANGIKFTQDEPGGVFMFPSN